MSEKTQQPSKLPQLVSLTEVQRRTNLSPGRIIRQCAQVWIDFTPADEDYRWLGRRLMARPRDPLVPMNGTCKLTEDGQQALANRTMNYMKWKGFALVKDLTVETETGILIVSSLSKGTCPPIPTPQILVSRQELDNLIDQKITVDRDPANLDINQKNLKEKSTRRGFGPQKVHTKFFHQLIEKGETDAHQAWLKFIAAKNNEEGDEIDGERYWIKLTSGSAKVQINTDGSGEYSLSKETFVKLFRKQLKKTDTNSN